MSYKYQDEIKMSLEHFNAGRRVMDGGIYAFESKLAELDHVYAQAAKADESEAKAKAFDEVLKTYEESISEGHMADDVCKIVYKYGRGGYDE